MLTDHQMLAFEDVEWRKGGTMVVPAEIDVQVRIRRMWLMTLATETTCALAWVGIRLDTRLMQFAYRFVRSEFRLAPRHPLYRLWRNPSRMIRTYRRRRRSWKPLPMPGVTWAVEPS